MGLSPSLLIARSAGFGLLQVDGLCRSRGNCLPDRVAQVSKSLKVRIIVLSSAIALVAMGVVATLNYLRSVEQSINFAVAGLASETRLFSQKLSSSFYNIEDDAVMAAKMPPVQGLVRAAAHNGVDPDDNSVEAQLRRHLEVVFTSVLDARPDYIQMQFLSAARGGGEIVRVYRAPGKSPVAVSDLKQSGLPPYLEEANRSALGLSQFSEIELSDYPELGLKKIPVLHFSVPVFDQQDSLFGFIVIDINYAKLLAGVLSEGNPERDSFIFNGEGDYGDRVAGQTLTRFHFRDDRAAPFPISAIDWSTGLAPNEALMREDGYITYFARRPMHAHRTNAYLAVAYRVPETAFTEPAYETRRETVLVGLALVGLTILVSYLVSLRFSAYVIDVASRSRAVIDSAIDGIVSIDAKGTILSCNPSTERIFHYSAGELIGRNVSVLMPEPHAGQHDKYLENYRRTGVGRVIGVGREMEGRRKDGTLFPVDLSVSAFIINGKRTYTGIIRDISQRKDVERALKTTQSRYDTVIRAMSVGYWRLDLRTGELNWSDRSREIAGISADEPLPTLEQFAAMRHPDDAPIVAARLEAHLTRGEPYDVEYRWYRPDGKMVWLQATGIASFDEEGRPLEMIGSVADITERKETESERERLILALAQSNRDLDEFAYVASHDLKAPLRVIDNAASWLEEDLADKLDVESRENLALLRGRASRMEKLLDDLLEYSRIGRKTNAQFAEIVSGEILREDLLLLIAQKPGFEVSFDGGFLQMRVNRMPLQQILINLINNGIKHHDQDQGRVRVSAIETDATYTISVEDDGPGIPERFHEQIFKMFQTLKPRDRVEGSGIGLAVVRKHLDVLGMSLELQKAGERGSIFRFTYPRGG